MRTDMLRKNPQIWLFLSIFTFFYGRTDLKKRIFQPFWLLTATTEYWTGMLRNMYGNHSPSVVYLLIPTSNHNEGLANVVRYVLYIFWFLHQTTTPYLSVTSAAGCISFDSYIKPQLELLKGRLFAVVYLLIPTSNHNLITEAKYADMLYIFWFLHQTTTGGVADQTCKGCISFDSYIKPQQLTEHKKKC